MAKPWEKYQQPAQEGPWQQYQTPEKEPEKAESLDISRQEIAQIAKKHNLNPEQAEQLDSIKSYFGAISSEFDPETTGKEFIGQVSEVFAMGIPQWMYKKFQSDKMEDAIDDMNQLIRERSPWYKTVTEIAGGFGGALKGARIAGKAAQAGSRAAKLYEPVTAVTAPAAEMLAEAKRGEELQEAAKGAALGVAFAGGLGGAAYAGKKLKDMSQAAIRRMDEQLAQMPDIIEKAEQKLANKAEEIQLKLDIVRNQAYETLDKFKQFTDDKALDTLLTKADKRLLKNPSSAKARALIESLEIAPEDLKPALAFGRVREDISEKLGDSVFRLQPTRAAQDYQEMIRRSALLEEAAEFSNILPKWSPLRRAQFVISDARPLAKTIDTKLGTDMSQVLDDISARGIKYQVEITPLMEELSTLQKQTRRDGVDSVKLFNALDSGESADIPKELFNRWKRFFSEAADRANQLGIKIDKRKNYVPYRRLSGLKYLEALKDRGKEIQEGYDVNIQKLNKVQFDELINEKDFKELVKELEFIHKQPIDNYRVFNAKYNQTFQNTSQVYNRLKQEAVAAYQRIGELPEFVKNKDTGNLASNWLQNTFKAAQIQPGLAKLETVMKVAQKMGDKESARYVGDLLADITGTRKTIATSAKDIMNNFQQAMEIRADKTKDPIKKAMYNGISYIPSFLSTAGRQVYANYLGLNPKSVLQNIASPWIMTVGELGPSYTTKLYLESMLDIVKAKKSGINIEKFLADKGFLPPQWKGELLDAMKESSRRSAVGDAGRVALEKYENLMLGLFNKSEQLARFVNYSMGRRIARDMVKNPEIRAKMMRSMDPAYQRTAKKALEEKNYKKLEENVATYLNAQNMFNYDRANMSAFGRQMGPMFSVFSKWPTTIVGRIIQETADKGMMAGGYRVGQTLLAPYLGLAMADLISKPENNDLYNRVVGRGGLKDWTPFDSVISGMEGGLVESPGIQAGRALFSALQTDKDGAFSRWVQDTYNTFGFGSGLLRFLGEDVPIYMGEKKPEGPKMERRIESIIKLIED